MDNGNTILIADDEIAILQAFARSLQLMGNDVLTASDGREAIEIYEREHPDIALLDVRMPHLDGFEVLRAIREIDPHAEVILITGHGDVETVGARALEAGAADFLSKPVARATLAAAIQRARERLNTRQ
jgi:DNA-binding NtrC family response regulator